MVVGGWRLVIWMPSIQGNLEGGKKRRYVSEMPMTRKRETRTRNESEKRKRRDCEIASSNSIWQWQSTRDILSALARGKMCGASYPHPSATPTNGGGMCACWYFYWPSVALVTWGKRLPITQDFPTFHHSSYLAAAAASRHVGRSWGCGRWSWSWWSPWIRQCCTAWFQPGGTAWRNNKIIIADSYGISFRDFN